VPPEDGLKKDGGSRPLPPSDTPTLQSRTHDWEPVLREFSGLLREIIRSELVQSDREAQRIILEMVNCKDLAEIDAQMDVLVARVNELLAAKSGEANAAPMVSAGLRGRASLRTISSPHTAVTDEPESRPARTFLRL